jgi:hypothetical protein
MCPSGGGLDMQVGQDWNLVLSKHDSQITSVIHSVHVKTLEPHMFLQILHPYVSVANVFEHSFSICISSFILRRLLESTITGEEDISKYNFQRGTLSKYIERLIVCPRHTLI